MELKATCKAIERMAIRPLTTNFRMTVRADCYFCMASLCLYAPAAAAAAAAKTLQLWLCDPIDGSPPGSPIPGILQARTLEWVAISFSSA